MADTFTQCHHHVFFSTKQRAKLIGADIRERLWKYLTGICRNIDLIPVAVGGMDDHIHMLFHLPPDRALSDAIRLLKTNSSRWMNAERPSESLWVAGRLRSIRGKRFQPAKVVRYIHHQEMHHRKMTFEEEYLGLLRKHQVKFDPRFVFD